jgi:hypothetical protein
MQPRLPGPTARRCAFCHEPLRFDGRHVDALPAGNQFVCSEFCAQAIREEAQFQRRAS